MDGVILAGGIPQEGELLYEETGGRSKALIEIAGKPMVQWVLDALTGSTRIERLVIVGLNPEDGVASPKLAAYVEDQGSLLRNIIAGVEGLLGLNPAEMPGQVVISSADIPLVTAGMVDQLIEQCADQVHDFYYGVVNRELMEGRFPESRRSYVHLVEGDFAGADLNVINPQIIYSNRQRWEELIGRRKNALKQARMVGLGTLLRLLLRRLTLAEAERRASDALGIRGKVVMVKHAELAMDVDKPFQLEICRQELVAR